MKKISRFLIVLLVSFFSFIGTLGLKAAPKTVTILATSDLHNHFVPYDYATLSALNKGGLSKVATIINNERKTSDVVLIDNGDTIQGNSSMLFLEDDVLPMVKGLNELNYDVFNAGNHEFNYGMDIFKKIRDTFNGDFLSANVYEGNEVLDENRVAKNYTIVEKNGVRVAVIGVVSPHITRWDKANLEGFTVTSPYDEVEKALAYIEENETYDLIVVSFHAGIDGEYGDDSAMYIAEHFEQVDLVIAGHAHENRINQASNGTYVIEPGRFGEFLSKVTFSITNDGDNKVVEVTGIENIAIGADVIEDTTLKAFFDADNNRAINDAKEIIGELKGGNLIEDNEFLNIPQGQLQDSAFIDLILSTQIEEASKVVENKTQRIVSGAALFNVNANVSAGQLTKADMSKIYMYDNTLTVLEINGAQLKDYMEWSARYYNTFKPGDLTISFNKDIRAYNYDMFGGIDYKVDISKEVGNRVVDLKYSDTKDIVNDDDVMYLVINNYRANGLRNDLPSFNGTQIVYDSSGSQVEAIRDMIKNKIADVGEINPIVDNNWEVIGTSFDENLRNIARELVNSSAISIPFSQDGRTPNVRSLTANDLIAAENVINIYSINDFHGSVLEAGKNVGAAKVSGYVNALKEINPNTIFVSAGDQYQGSAISNLTKGNVVNEFFKEAGIEFSAIGNHEFDWGIENIAKWQEEAGFKFLASNIVYEDSKEPVEWATPYVIKEINGKKFGFIGIATPDTKFSTSPENVADLEFLDPVESATKYAKILKDNGADYVIALTHLGAYQEGQNVTGDGANLAMNAVGLDGVITGHTHQFVSGVVNNIPVVQGGYNGRGLAGMHFAFNDSGDLIGVWQESTNLSNLSNSIIPNPEVQAIIDKYLVELDPILGEVIGVSDAFNHTPTDIQQVTPMGYQVAKMMAELGETQIAIINGGGIRAGFSEGDITMGEMYSIFPFDNTLVTGKVTGKDLKKLIEHGLFPDSFKAGQFYGIKVNYEMIDGKAKVLSMRLNDGTIVKDNQLYSVSFLDFMYSGGDKYDFSNAIDVVDTLKPLRDLFVEYIKDQQVIDDLFINPLTLGEDTEFTLDLTKAKALLEKVDLLDSSKYTLDSWNAVVSAKENLLAAMDSFGYALTPQEVINEKVDILEKAIANLKLKSDPGEENKPELDLTVANTVLAEVAKLDSTKYTSESWSKVVIAKDDLIKTMESFGYVLSNQEIIDSKVLALQTAIKQLVLKTSDLPKTAQSSLIYPSVGLLSLGLYLSLKKRAIE